LNILFNLSKGFLGGQARTARKHDNLIELPRDLVCSPPLRAVALSEPEAGSQSPAGLPAAPFLDAAHRLGSAFRIPRIAPFRKTF
jgi:hypothetical protein